MGCCNDERAHCHGVLVRHADGRWECEEGPTCGAGPPTHDWVVGCAEVGCPCGAVAEVLLAA